MAWKVLELFSGLGGWRYALGSSAEVVAAYDISPAANATYALNHGDRPHARELASIPPRTLLKHEADLWVMSPPCQPFCRMGNNQGLEDRRSAAFLRLMDILEAEPPRAIVLENVEGFDGSDAHALLTNLLTKHGFEIRTWRLCPTALGIPNQRPRFYLAASRDRLIDLPLPNQTPGALEPWLDDPEDEGLYLNGQTLSKHKPGLDLVRPLETRSACFIGGYGQRFVGSGSFLVTERGIRRFSPREIARLMGLPPSFSFPDDLALEKRYKLLGNGLSVPVARWVLAHVVRDLEP